MKFLIIEDEPLAARRLEKMIVSVRPESEMLAHLESVEESVAWLHTHDMDKIELAFVDIQLADGTSFEIFHLVETDFPVIFTTAYDAYAIQAFQVNAIDYLLKPVKRNELADAIQKYEKYDRIKMSGENLARLLSEMKPSYKERFVVKVGRTIRVVRTADVAYFYTEDRITFLMDKDGKRYPVEMTLEQLESVLDPSEFYRANRQFIVHIRHIREMLAYSKSRLKLKLDPPIDRQIVVSTERASDFKEWLSGDK